jgi:GNAT superfamily N-acetyltransferase
VSASPSATFRRGTLDDLRPCHDLLIDAVVDLTRRQCVPWEGNAEESWPRWEPMYRLLAEHGAEWWVAEDATSGALLGYARSLERGGLFELSELFVRPDTQSAGVGRQLLERAFPLGRGEVRVIIATTDVRALRRYYGAGTVARFPIATLSRAPEGAAGTGRDGDLDATSAAEADIPALQAIERVVLEFDRGEVELRWLLDNREGYLYQRGGEPVGFAFIGTDGVGPIAALDPADQPSILKHIERRAAELGRDELGFEVPMVNEVAMQHLLGRGFRIDAFLTILLSSRAFGQFDRFISFGPPLVL